MRLRRMNSVAAWFAACSAVLGMGLVISTGCGDRRAADQEQSEPFQVDPTSVPSTQALAGARNSQASDAGPSPSVTAQTAGLAAEPPSLSSAQTSVQDPPSTQQQAGAAASGPASPSTPADQQMVAQSPPTDGTGSAGSPAAAALPSGRLQLRTDLSPERLVDFLRSVDVEMQSVATGRKGLFDVEEANAELQRLSKLKLEAAEQLEQHAEAQPPQRVVAIRGRLQALSHLAALGNLPAAEQLESFARQHVTSDHPAVALDSRLVLVGLAMERLQNGSATNADELLALIDQIAAADQTPDVSALMVMGQARAVLQQYGYDEAAQRVRTVIVDLFVDHPNPDVGAMALQLVGSAGFSQLNELLRAFERREPLTVDQWKAAVESLLSESADMAAVQFLASAALQFEAFGNDELADATFAVLTSSDRFSQEEAQEIAVAAQARQTRRDIIGKPVDFDLPSVDGRPLSLASYTGKVVLMPFWAVAFPDSLKVLQTLDQLREQFSGQVEIVGMNLDAADAPADEFLRQSPVKFRSFESVSPSGGAANEMATRFGVVSLPFIVIIAPDATVAAINLTGQGLDSQIQKLLAP